MGKTPLLLCFLSSAGFRSCETINREEDLLREQNLQNH